MSGVTRRYWLEETTLTLVECLLQAGDKIIWSSEVLQLIQNIKTTLFLLEQCSSQQKHITLLYEIAKQLELSTVVHLERHISERNGHCPFYTHSFRVVLQIIQDILGKCNQDSGPSIKELERLAAELEIMITEYGFAKMTSALYDVTEAANKLKNSTQKLGDVEDMMRRSEHSQAISNLFQIVAGYGGIKLAMTENNTEKMRQEFTNFEARVATVHKSISGKCIKVSSDELLKYMAAQRILKMPFVNQIPYRDPTDTINDHLIHPETREWFMEQLEKWLNKSEKRILCIGANKGSGKTALCSALCKIYSNHVVAAYFFDEANSSNTIEAMILSIASGMLRTLPEYLNYIDDKSQHIQFNNLGSTNWRVLYTTLLQEPLQSLYGTGQTVSRGMRRRIIVVDGLDFCEVRQQTELKSFFLQFMQDVAAFFCFFLTVRTEQTAVLIPDAEFCEKICFEDRAWISRHIRDIEIYLATSLGAILSGEDKKETPKHAKADEMTLQNAIDELLKASAGRFDYALSIMDVFATDMASSSQFLTSLRRAIDSVRDTYGAHYEKKVDMFCSPYRAYRDKEGRSVCVRVMRQSQYLKDKNRVALIRKRSKRVP